MPEKVEITCAVKDEGIGGWALHRSRPSMLRPRHRHPRQVYAQVVPKFLTSRLGHFKDVWGHRPWVSTMSPVRP